MFAKAYMGRKRRGAAQGRKLKQDGLEVDPAGRFLGGNFRVADYPPRTRKRTPIPSR
jgi:hypothetical protein